MMSKEDSFMPIGQSYRFILRQLKTLPQSISPPSEREDSSFLPLIPLGVLDFLEGTPVEVNFR